MPKIPMVEMDKFELLALQMMAGTREEVAEKLGVAKSVIDRWLSQGRIPVAQLERLKALPPHPEYNPRQPSLKTVNFAGPNWLKDGQEPRPPGNPLLHAFKTEELIKELSDRGLDVLVKRPAAKRKAVP